MNAMKGAFLGRPSRRTLCALVVVLLLGAVACRKQVGVESSKKVAPAPPVEAKGPIIAMVMASSVDAKGRVINPRFNFPQKEPQITAIVRVGKIAGSPLNVAWYKTSDDGDEKLFQHQIQVKSNDRAFSVGKNPGRALAAGTYKVVATLEGQTQEMNWDVTRQKPVASNDRASSSGETRDQTRGPCPYQRIALIDSAQTSPNPAATPPGSSDADGQPPVAGSSGTLPPIGTASDICIGGGDEDMCGPEILDSTAPFVDLYVHNGSDQAVNVRGALTQGSAVGQDQLSPVGTVTPAEHSKEFRWDPCYYFPGSDLPGAKFQFFVSTTGTVVTLGNDTSDPTVKVISTPARGTKVRTGDKINLKVTANEQRSGGSWQTGVKVIQITAEPGGLVKEPWVNSSNLPKACDDKTWEQKDEATYTVPKDPPPIIKICALAEDYVGNQAQPICVKFRTVEVWHGTWEHFIDTTSYSGDQRTRIKRDEVVAFDLYEASKDKLEGQAHATWTSSEEVTDGKCAGVKLIQDPETVAWDAQLTGSIQRLPGSTRFDFHATPDRGRPYKVIETPGGECTTGGTEQWNDNEWSGTNFDLKSGQDHIDESRNIPQLAPEVTGQELYKFHVESSGK